MLHARAHSHEHNQLQLTVLCEGYEDTLTPLTAVNRNCAEHPSRMGGTEPFCSGPLSDAVANKCWFSYRLLLSGSGIPG